MFTTVAFQERRTTIAMSELNAVPDETHYTTGDDLRIGKYNRIIGAFVCGNTPQDGYLISPSLRAFSRVYITPLIQHDGMNKTPSQGYPNRFDDRSQNPIPIETGESLNAFYEKSADAASDDDMIGVWLADGPIVPVHGDIRTVNAYCTGTYPQLVWTNDELTWTPDLPTGRYAIVGARAFTNNGIGIVRFVFRDQPQRPGVISFNARSLMSTDPPFRKGYLGIFGEFDVNNPPSVDIIGVRAPTSCYMRIDIMKVG